MKTVILTFSDVFYIALQQEHSSHSLCNAYLGQENISQSFTFHFVMKASSKNRRIVKFDFEKNTAASFRGNAEFNQHHMLANQNAGPQQERKPLVGTVIVECAIADCTCTVRTF